MVATQTLFFQKLAEMTDLNYLKSYLTYLVSPVITGIKPLSLLNLQNNHRPLVLMWEQEGEDFLQKHQLEQYVVKKSNKTLKLFIYNKSILERYLRKPHNLHFLRQFGYSGNAPLEEYLSYLKIRWKDSTFPHESVLKMGMVIMEGIRKKYYILLAFLALLMCAFCIFIPISSINRVETIYREYTREKIFDIKKTFLKDSVNNIIKSIESTQVEVMQKYEQRAKRLAIRFEGTIQAYPEEFVNFAKLSFSDPYNREVFTILILDKQTNEIIYKNLLPDFDQKDDIGNLIELLKEKSIGYHEIQNEEYCLIFMVLEEVIHRETKEDIKGRIHEDEFSNGSYFWVNEVLDYNGGENYAIRLIHPNLIDTEGMYLSTSMTDIKGNTPYLTELQGVVTEGEIFFNYYFEKKDSDEVSEKLTYAKLYEKYNWIIAMGVHLDDIQLYSDEIL